MTLELLRVPELPEEGGFLGGHFLRGRGAHLAGWNTVGFGEIVGLVVRGVEHVRLIVAVVGFWKIIHEGFESMAHKCMVDGGTAEEERHENNGAGGCVDGEEANKADFREVDACHELLENFCVGGAFGVDVISENVKGVVARCEVNDAEADGSKSKD